MSDLEEEHLVEVEKLAEKLETVAEVPEEVDILPQMDSEIIPAEEHTTL